jgi:hypothetical protein
LSVEPVAVISAALDTVRPAADSKGIVVVELIIRQLFTPSVTMNTISGQYEMEFLNIMAE